VAIITTSKSSIRSAISSRCWARRLEGLNAAQIFFVQGGIQYVPNKTDW